MVEGVSNSAMAIEPASSSSSRILNAEPAGGSLGPAQQVEWLQLRDQATNTLNSPQGSSTSSPDDLYAQLFDEPLLGQNGSSTQVEGASTPAPAFTPLPTASPEHIRVEAANQQVEIQQGAVDRAQQTFDRFKTELPDRSIADIDMRRVELHLTNAKIDLAQAKLEQSQARAEYKIAAGLGNYASPEQREAAFDYEAAKFEQDIYETDLMPLSQKALDLSADVYRMATVQQQNSDVVPITLNEELESRQAVTDSEIFRADTVSSYRQAVINVQQAITRFEATGPIPSAPAGDKQATPSAEPEGVERDAQNNVIE